MLTVGGRKKFPWVDDGSMADGGLERVGAVGGAGDKGPGQRKKIWAGVWTAADSSSGSSSEDGKVTLESGRTREELFVWLMELARETPRMGGGVDCGFSF